jgi:hypothetical protein
MNKMTGKMLGLAAVAIACSAALTGCNRGESQLASVNGEAITMQDLFNHMETKPTVRVIANGQSVELAVADTLGFQAFQDLVTQRLILQIAKDEGVAPTAKDIEDEIKFQTELRPAYIKELQLKGLTMDQIRRSVEVDLAQYNILTKGIKITDAQIDRAIKENPANFTDPATIQVVQIVARNAERRKQVDDALRAGRDFRSVADRFSEVPQRENTLNMSQLRQAARNNAAILATYNKINGTQVNQYTDWVDADAGSQARLLVMSKTPEKKREVTPALRKQVGRELARLQGSQAVDLNARILKKLEDAQVNVGGDSSLRELWKRFEDNLRRNLKEQGGGTNAGAATGGNAPARNGN